MLAGQLALTIAAVFTGAAIYINFAEQPARLQLDDRSLLAKPAYKRGYVMQASLVIVGGLFAYLNALDRRWLFGAPPGTKPTDSALRTCPCVDGVRLAIAAIELASSPGRARAIETDRDKICRNPPEPRGLPRP
jgi:hypothetical protein